MECNVFINTKRILNSFYGLLISGTLTFLILHARCNETIYGREGDNITLVCPFSQPNLRGRTTWEGPPSFQIFFFLNDLKNPNAFRGERLSVVRNETTGVYNLIITNLTRKEDEGLYSCDITHPIQQKFIKLSIYDLPIITVFQANQIQEVNESSTFGITCIVNSSTSLNMSIKMKDKKDGEVISESVFTDTINFTETSAKCYQTAEYICTATNIAGSIESTPVQISVNCGPTPINTAKVQRTYVSLGEKLDLSANVTGYPTPKYKWMFISTDLTSSKTISNSFIEMFVTLNITTYSFRLKKNFIAEDEFGLYTLQLSNIHGMITFHFYVIKKVSLEVPQNISLVCSSEVTAIYRHGEKTSNEQTCTIPDKPQSRSVTVPLLSTFIGMLLLACFGQIIYMTTLKIYPRTKKDNRASEENGKDNYIMQSINKMDDHQYQTITSDQKDGPKHQKSTKQTEVSNSEATYDVVLENKGQYQNIN